MTHHVITTADPQEFFFKDGTSLTGHVVYEINVDTWGRDQTIVTCTLRGVQVREGEFEIPRAWLIPICGAKMIQRDEDRQAETWQDHLQNGTHAEDLAA